jgi:ribosomal protein L4
MVPRRTYYRKSLQTIDQHTFHTNDTTKERKKLMKKIKEKLDKRKAFFTNADKVNPITVTYHQEHSMKV